MVNIVVRFSHAVALVAVLSLATAAQQSKTSALLPAPIPTQINTATKIFISNVSGESSDSVIYQTVFNGGPDRAYNEFYAAMKSVARYDLVSSPSDADLVLEIGWALSDTSLRQLPVLGKLRLVIVDPKTHIALWNITEYVRGAIQLGNRDKNFDRAMDTVVARLKSLASAGPTSRNTAN